MSDKQLLKAASDSIGKTFRGTLWENAQRFKLIGKAYEAMPREQDGHFKIESARQLAGPMTALLDVLIRLIHVIGATQVLKSVIGDVWTPYVVEHLGRNMAIYFEDELKAKQFCDARLMLTLTAHPVIKKLIANEDRHDATKVSLRIAGQKLAVMGLNDGNVSTLSWPIIWISEAWQHGRDGLMWKAYKRADRFPDDSKILNESQASEAGTDLHVSAREAFQVPLTWACPACGGRQTWEWQHWNHKRPEDYKPRPVEGVEVPKPGTYAGMKFLDDGEGTRSVQQRAASAYWECIWCGSRIEDRKPIRQKLMDGYEQNYRSDVVHPKLTFTLPFESARDNRFSATVESFLIAKHEERQGNKVKLAQWFMAERAVFFSEEMLQPQIVQVVENYDPNKAIPDEHHKGMTVDCQKHKTEDTVGTFHYSVDAVDKSGNSFEIARGFAESFEEWIAIQKKFKIPNRLVNVDGRKWTPKILQMAAANREIVSGMQYGRPVQYLSCWNILLGDAPARQYKWPDGQYRVWAPPTRRTEIVTDANGKREAVSIFMYRWSNLSVKDLLHEILIGGEGKVKFAALPREALLPRDQLIEVGDMTYDAQMSSEMRTEKNGRASWEKIGNRPNHRWDIACMRLVRLLMNNLIGYVATAEETK